MCKKIFQKVSSSKMLGFITLVCAGVLATAYIMEHYFAVYPCQMCLYERQIFMVAGGVALISFVFLTPRLQSYVLIGVGFIFMGGAFLAAYHVAIQHHWVSLPAFCASNDFSAITSVEDLKNQLLKTPFVRCDQVTWSLFGLSLAFYNCLLSLVLALLCWKWAQSRK
jgi:disulfide bond formation protein DsbB